MGVAADVRDTRARLGQLQAIASRIPTTEIIATVIDALDSDIVLDSVQHNVEFGEAGKEGRLKLNGESRDREAILSFVKRLERTTLFSEVDLPISNLAARANISFSITMNVVTPAESQ